MDFAKAFDKVPHCRLLYKLKFYGIQKDILNWIKAFLSDRTQTVVINGTSSTSVPVTGYHRILIYIGDDSEELYQMLLQNPLLLSQFVYYSYYFLPVLV
jgi:hypothetical protein